MPHLYSFLFNTTDPQVFSGHTGSLKHVLFMNEGKQMLSCAEDKTIRLWDKASAKVRSHMHTYMSLISVLLY